MKPIEELKNQIPSFFLNKYILSILAFLIWVLFIDTNNVISQIKMKLEINRLNRQKEYYQEGIKELHQERSDLFTDEKSLERLAREKYYMKRDGEDIFIIEEVKE